tara:strand:+ start:1033 stop:1200 length:168 start_codon:yes stop_codon:yes gene_type:complete
MFGLFKGKTPEEKLHLEYKQLMEEAHKLSTSNRSLSDQKIYEAEEILKKIDALTK